MLKKEIRLFLIVLIAVALVSLIPSVLLNIIYCVQHFGLSLKSGVNNYLSVALIELVNFALGLIFVMLFCLLKKRKTVALIVLASVQLAVCVFCPLFLKSDIATTMLNSLLLNQVVGMGIITVAYGLLERGKQSEAEQQNVAQTESNEADA